MGLALPKFFWLVKKEESNADVEVTQQYHMLSCSMEWNIGLPVNLILLMWKGIPFYFTFLFALLYDFSYPSSFFPGSIIWAVFKISLRRLKLVLNTKMAKRREKNVTSLREIHCAWAFNIASACFYTSFSNKLSYSDPCAVIIWSARNTLLFS